MPDYNILEVRLWGRRLGALAWDDAAQLAEFQYDPDYARDGWPVSPLLLPLSNQVYRFPELAQSETFRGLPGLIADSLTEKYGNTLLANWLARHGLRLEDLNPLERLCYLGSRGMGALEFVPDRDPSSDRLFPLAMDELVELSREIMSRHAQPQVVRDEEEALRHLIQIGTSAGGAKAKAIVAWNQASGELLSGQGDCPPGFEHWLVKFSGVENAEHTADQDVGRLEYAYYLLALRAGITMMESRLLENRGEAHFMTRRFDRVGRSKVHVQTFCALAHQDRNPVGNTHYEVLFSTARRLGLGQEDLDELYRRMVFNILARNQDDHSKNHAFLMDGQGEWYLSPAYDLVFSYKAGSRWVEKQQMCCNGKRDHFTKADLLEASRAADIRQPERILNEVNEALRDWPAFAEQAGLNPRQYRAIEEHFRQV